MQNELGEMANWATQTSFMEYVIDLETIPPPLQPDKPFLSPATA